MPTDRLRLGAFGLTLLFAGCAERDNPWDSAARPASPVIQAPKPFQPKPGPTSKVVLPDSSSRDPSNPYFANLQSAIASLEPGDTMWIQGGRDYTLSDGLQMAFGGNYYQWIVIRSFGGEARILDGRPGSISALMTLTGSGWVELRGLAFVRCKGAGFRANGLQGPLRIDSCRFDTNGTYGIETRGLRDAFVLRHLQLRRNVGKPQLNSETPVDSLDVHIE